MKIDLTKEEIEVVSKGLEALLLKGANFEGASFVLGLNAKLITEMNKNESEEDTVS